MIDGELIIEAQHFRPAADQGGGMLHLRKVAAEEWTHDFRVKLCAKAAAWDKGCTHNRVANSTASAVAVRFLRPG